MKSIGKIARILIGFIFGLCAMSNPGSVLAQRAESLVVLKDDFIDSYHVLVARTAPLYKDELWVVEYGIGCLSMWRFEGKEIVAEYSTYLDGIGGQIYLPGRGSCRIWNANELKNVKSDLRTEDWKWLISNNLSIDSEYSASSPYYSAPLPSCPSNAVRQSDGICYCNDGYEVNSDKTQCIQKTCPGNSYLFGNTCVCMSGRVMKGGQCLTYYEDCRSTFGEHTIGMKGTGDFSNCTCETGYDWNSAKTACVTSNASQQVTIKGDGIIDGCKASLGDFAIFNIAEQKCACAKGYVVKDNLCVVAPKFFVGVPKNKADLLLCKVVGNKLNKLYYLQGAKTIKSMTYLNKQCFEDENSAKKFKFYKAKNQ